MKEKELHDKDKELRKQLQEKLSDVSPADDQWNVPSDRVWAGMSEKLTLAPAPRKNRIGQYVLLTTSILLLALLLFRECSHYQKVQQLNTDIQQTRDSLQKLQNDCLKQSESTATPPAESQLQLESAPLIDKSLSLQTPAGREMKNDYSPPEERRKTNRIAENLTALKVSGIGSNPTLSTTSGSPFLKADLPEDLQPVTPISEINMISGSDLTELQVEPRQLPLVQSQEPKNGGGMQWEVGLTTAYLDYTSMLSGQLPDLINRIEAQPGWGDWCTRGGYFFQEFLT